jgi:hypothetical protein
MVLLQAHLQALQLLLLLLVVLLLLLLVLLLAAAWWCCRVLIVVLLPAMAPWPGRAARLRRPRLPAAGGSGAPVRGQSITVLSDHNAFMQQATCSAVCPE